MEYVVEGTPQRLLPQAEAFMASEGYGIDSRSDTSVTFSRMPPMGGGTTALMFADVFLNPNQVSQDITAWSNIKWTATLVATPTGDGRTRLTVGGASGPSLELLQFWVQADVLKVPGVEPILKLRDTKPFRGYVGLLIFNDRIEFHEGTFFLKLKGDPIPMTEVKEVGIKKGRLTEKLTVEAMDGRSMTIGNLDPQKAANAKALIERRMAMYSNEGVSESPIVPQPPEDDRTAPSRVRRHP